VLQWIEEVQVRHPLGQSIHILLVASVKVDWVGQVVWHWAWYNGNPLSQVVQ
jgi:hypothetical protein